MLLNKSPIINSIRDIKRFLIKHESANGVINQPFNQTLNYFDFSFSLFLLKLYPEFVDCAIDQSPYF